VIGQEDPVNNYPMTIVDGRTKRHRSICAFVPLCG